jgi:hypothetical protein
MQKGCQFEKDSALIISLYKTGNYRSLQKGWVLWTAVSYILLYGAIHISLLLIL